jgi:hypothetical protein
MSPEVINKIRLNGPDFDADAYSMLSAFEVAAELGKEVIELGGGHLKGNALIKEDGLLHLAEQEAICADLDAVMEDCIKRQRALNDKRRKWLDTKL